MSGRIRTSPIIAQVKPAIAYIVDIRRENLLLHLLFKALFAQARTRAEYLAMLTGRAPPADPEQAAPLARLACRARRGGRRADHVAAVAGHDQQRPADQRLHQSGEAVKVLEENGFSSVSRMRGGMAEWQTASPWYFRGEANEVTRKGINVFAGAQGTSPGNGFVDLPSPIDYKTRNYTGEVGYAGTRGHLDKIPAKEVQAWEKQFLTFMHHQKPEIWEELDQKKDLSDELTKKIESAIKEFQSQYASGETAKKKPEAPKRQPVAV